MARLTQEQIEKLRAENEALKIKVADQAGKSDEMIDALGDRISNEMKKIRAKGKSTANTIQVVEQHDHKNVSLWTKDGKRIGPLHPENAIQTLNRFADIGIVLSSDQPTAEKIAAYKETAEYKRILKKEQERRALKDRSRKSGELERLTKEIAKLSGVTVDAVNNILKPNEIKKPNEVNR